MGGTAASNAASRGLSLLWDTECNIIFLISQFSNKKNPSSDVHTNCMKVDLKGMMLAPYKQLNINRKKNAQACKQANETIKMVNAL